MGNGEWGMGNGEWGMGNGEWGWADRYVSTLRGTSDPRETSLPWEAEKLSPAPISNHKQHHFGSEGTGKSLAKMAAIYSTIIFPFITTQWPGKVHTNG